MSGQPIIEVQTGDGMWLLADPRTDTELFWLNAVIAFYKGFSYF